MTHDLLCHPGDEATRVRLGANASTAADVLVQLAHDPAVTVRAAVAMNRGATPLTDLVLTNDGDERVRAFLAQKLSRLLPRLSQTEQNQAGEHVLSVLSTLVEDVAVRVRAAIADTVKSMPDAPHALILRLAHDAAPPVSDPVIRLSPLLTDADLLALLAAPPHPLAPLSVAVRPNLSETVADAIAARADNGTVRALLGNPSAAIREGTLDALVAQAPGRTDWHAPLVRRSGLGAHAIHALSEIVAGHLVTELVQRADLPPALTASLRARMADRLPRAATPDTDADLLIAARRLNAAGALDEAVMLEAVAAGQGRRVAVMLAVASGMTLAAVDRACTQRNTRAVMALVWRAGFTMRAAAAVQPLLGLGSAILLPGSGGDFPLQPDEMEWQLEVLGQVGR